MTNKSKGLGPDLGLDLGGETGTITYQLTEQEYVEFVCWYQTIFFKGKRGRFYGPDFTNIRERVTVKTREHGIVILSENRESRLLYSAIRQLWQTDTLFLFYDQEQFWAVPRRAFGEALTAEKWEKEVTGKIHEEADTRVPIPDLIEACTAAHIPFVSHIRRVDDVVEACLPLHQTRRGMNRLRRLQLFPYRLIGQQMAAAEKELLLEYSERSVIGHRYSDIARAFYTEKTLYLLKRDGTSFFLPMDVCGGVEGAGEFVELCDKKREVSEPLTLKKRRVLFYKKWNVPWKKAASVAALLFLVGAAFLGIWFMTDRQKDGWQAGDNHSAETWSAQGNDEGDGGGMNASDERGGEIFYGYYGDNIYMTSCLVLIEREMSAEEIGTCLERVKKIAGSGFGFRTGCDTLAVRTPESRWLGIDCESLQQNCYAGIAKKVSRIFGAPVILYDEFDGDLLMVAYSDAQQKQAVSRATSYNKEMLEEEFSCYGEEQDFPEELLQYMDLTKEEAETIWKRSDDTFQIEKWYELTSHMTKKPVPEEFVGLYDYSALDGRFEVIKR